MVRPLALCALAAISSLALTQTSEFEEPCALEKDGVFLGIAWRTKGGHRIIFDDEKRVGFSPFSFTLSLFGNEPLYEMLRNKGSKPSFGGSMIRTSKGGIVVPQVDTTSSGSNFQEFSTGKIIFPGGDAGSKDPRGVRVSGEITGRELDFPRRLTAEMVQTARRQKLWNASAFRVSIGTIPTENIVRFEPIELTRTPGGDLDGDGVPDIVESVSELIFEVPKDAAGPYKELAQATFEGRAVELPMRVQYLDEDGIAVMSLSAKVIVRGWDPVKICEDTNSPSNNVTVYAKIKREMIIERERKG